MHSILDLWNMLFGWLLADNAARATVILVFITAIYVILTWRMTAAIARQTRAMIQPVACLEFHWAEGKKWCPEGYFEIKNVGTQPLLLLDINLVCSLRGEQFRELYELWDEHIIPPGESLRPQFDFKRQFEQDKLQWDPSFLGYSLEVVASDLSKQVVLTYLNIPVLSIVNVQTGMPLSVRWRYFRKPFERHYRRVFYRFKPPKS